MSTPSSFWPQGTVYGPLLNFQAELHALAPQMPEPPYKGAPRAPVLYLKPANTWCANGGSTPLPAPAAEVEVGASLAMVLGPPTTASRPGQASPPGVAGWVLVNDLCVPHASFFRPAVKARCRDGFLGIGPRMASPLELGDTAALVLEVRVNGSLRQTVRFAELARDANTLLADVAAFLPLQAGDLLLLGCDAGRPLAHAGDTITIHASGCPALGVLHQTLHTEATP